MQLAAIIQNYRQTHNLTMDEFARRAKISKAYISMLEKGKHSSSGKPIQPSLSTLKNIANAMFLNLDDLLNMMDSNTTISLKSPQPSPVSINLHDLLQSSQIMFFSKNGKPISEQARNEIKNYIEYVLSKESEEK